jgi:hypothetical protein
VGVGVLWRGFTCCGVVLRAVACCGVLWRGVVRNEKRMSLILHCVYRNCRGVASEVYVITCRLLKMRKTNSNIKRSLFIC